MAPSARLGLAGELIRRVLKFDAPADGIVAAYFEEHRALGPRERQALADTVFHVVRNRLVLLHLAHGGPGPVERRLAILGWQGAAGAVEAALDPAERQWRATALAVDRRTLPATLRNEMPDWLAQRLLLQLGTDELGSLAEALNAPAPLDLRVNLLRARRAEVQGRLRQEGIESAPTPYSPWGLRLASKPSLTRLPAFARGDFEVQDEGSQLLALLTGAGRGEIVVDFCAGGGGKTLALGAMMRNAGHLYAFDTSAHRLAALKPRLLRSGLSIVYPAAIAHEGDERLARLGGKADRVLVDAPCTGLGTLRRHPDLRWRQTPADVERSRLRQEPILQAAARLVRPGGMLVYATCSLLREENEEVASAFDRSRHEDFVAVAADAVLRAARVANPDSLTSGPFLRLWPHLHATDGFFAAIWRRRQ